MLHIKNKASVPKHPNASSSRVSATQKTVRNVDSERWLRKVSSASDSKRPKHQQDSSPCQAKNTQTECFTSPLEPIRKNKASVPKHPNASSSRASAKRKTVCNVDSERWPLKVSSASDSKRPKHQQDSSPCQAKNTQTECFTSPLEPIKNKASVPKQPNASMSRAHAKQKTRRKNASCRWLLEPRKNNALVRLHNTRTPARFEPIKNNALVRFHNTQTPARFEPMLRKKHADRMLHVTFGTYNPLKSAKNIKKTIKNKALVRFRNTRTPWIPNDGCSKSRQRQIRKDQNTSKIRAHAKQKTRRQNASRHLWNP